MRSTFRSQTETQDITGAQTGTLKRGIQTNRKLNPLNPNYQFPGHIQDADPNSKAARKQSAAASVDPPKPATPAGSRGGQLQESQQLFDSYAPPLAKPDNSAKRRASEARTPSAHQANKENPTPKSIKDAGSVDGNSNRRPSEAEISIKSQPINQSEIRPSLSKQASQSQKDAQPSIPLHKRIDREEYLKDVQKFYGSGLNESQPLEKISKIQENIEVDYIKKRLKKE